MADQDAFEAAAQAMAERDPDGETADVVAELLEMPRGWPRPTELVHGRRLPIPFIAKLPDDVHPPGLALGQASVIRRALCVMDRRCQVCGEPLGDRCVVLGDKGPRFEHVIDGAGLHPEPCWRAARRLCPALVRLIADGDLLMWEVDTDSLEVVDVAEVGPLVRVPTSPPTKTWERARDAVCQPCRAGQHVDHHEGVWAKPDGSDPTVCRCTHG